MFTRIFVVTLLIATILQAQNGPVKHLKTRYGFKIDRIQPITYHLFLQRTRSWKPVLYLAINILNDKLQFVKKDEGYVSQFRVSLGVRDENNVLTNKNSWTEKIVLHNFDETNSVYQMQYRQYRLPLFKAGWQGKQTGSFHCFLEIDDLISGEITTFKETVKVTTDSGNWNSTEIAFLRVAPQGNEISLLAQPDVLQFSKPSVVYVRLQNKKSDSLLFNLRIYQQNETGKSLYFQQFKTIKSDSGIFDVWFAMPHDSLEEGKYLLRLSTRGWQKEKKFSVVWFTKPTYLYRYDLAIRPMRLILDKKTYDFARKLSYDELEKWFKAYWKKRDPTKGTVYNELLAEFFHRVQVANQKFSTRHKEGWETDQGKIYILYGKPKEIDDHRYATDTLPYQVWIYSDSLQFLFVDKSRSGEFSLVKEEK